MKCGFCTSGMLYEVVEVSDTGWVMESDAQRVMVKNKIATRVEVLVPERFDCADFKVGYEFHNKPVVGDLIYEFGEIEHEDEYHLSDRYP